MRRVGGLGVAGALLVGVVVSGTASVPARAVGSSVSLVEALPGDLADVDVSANGQYLFGRSSTPHVTDLLTSTTNDLPTVSLGDRALIDDSGRVIFSTSDALDPADINGAPDTYAVDAAAGTFTWLTAGLSELYYGMSSMSDDGTRLGLTRYSSSQNAIFSGMSLYSLPMKYTAG